MESIKQIVGMIHLKALPNAPLNHHTLDEIFELAKKDLLHLQEGGVTAAIVENLFDYPYNTKVELETIISYVHLFTRLKEVATIPLGVNIQYTDGIEEMAVAHLLQADFIRAETFVENREGSFGRLNANANKLMRYKKLHNSSVKVLADVSVKHSFPTSCQTLEYSIEEAIQNGAFGVILTGLKTGENPSIKDIKMIKKKFPTVSLWIGSGIKADTIQEYLEYADGVIVGSSIKENGQLDQPISLKKVKELIHKR